MKTEQSVHAQQVVERFQLLLADTGEQLSQPHCDELALLIESALDALLVDRAEKMAIKLERMAHDLRQEEQFIRIERT